MTEAQGSREDRQLLLSEVSISVSTMSIFTAVAAAFAVVLLARSGGESSSQTLSVSLVALLGFFTSSLLYANASGNASRGLVSKAIRNIMLGNTISELFGVYPFLCSLPLTVLEYTNSSLLTVIVLVTCLAVGILYASREGDILNRYVSTLAQHIALVGAILMLIGATSLLRMLKQDDLSATSTGVMLVYLVILAGWMIRRKREDFAEGFGG